MFFTYTIVTFLAWATSKHDKLDRFRFKQELFLTNDGDVPSPDEVSLVSDEDDGFVVRRPGSPEVLEDLFGDVERLDADDAVHDHHRVRHVRRQRVLDLRGWKKQ